MADTAIREYIEIEEFTSDILARHGFVETSERKLKRSDRVKIMKIVNDTEGLKEARERGDAEEELLELAKNDLKERCTHLAVLLNARIGGDWTAGSVYLACKAMLKELRGG